VSNIVDFGMDPQQAIDGPRCFTEAGVTTVERGYSAAVSADLARRGHNVAVPDSPIGGAQAILIDEEMGTLTGGSDPRKDGCAIGY
jgi:gamma-glutamyltranspeptidase/glutathione hydrolase